MVGIPSIGSSLSYPGLGPSSLTSGLGGGLTGTSGLSNPSLLSSSMPSDSFGMSSPFGSSMGGLGGSQDLGGMTNQLISMITMMMSLMFQMLSQMMGGSQMGGMGEDPGGLSSDPMSGGSSGSSDPYSGTSSPDSPSGSDATGGSDSSPSGMPSGGGGGQSYDNGQGGGGSQGPGGGGWGAHGGGGGGCHGGGGRGGHGGGPGGGGWGGHGGPHGPGGSGGQDSMGGSGGPDTTGGSGGPDTTGGSGGPDTTGGSGGPDTTGGSSGPDTTGGSGGPDTTGGSGGADTISGSSGVSAGTVTLWGGSQSGENHVEFANASGKDMYILGQKGLQPGEADPKGSVFKIPAGSKVMLNLPDENGMRFQAYSKPLTSAQQSQISQGGVASGVDIPPVEESDTLFEHNYVPGHQQSYTDISPLDGAKTPIYMSGVDTTGTPRQMELTDDMIRSAPGYDPSTGHVGGVGPSPNVTDNNAKNPALRDYYEQYAPDVYYNSSDSGKADKRALVYFKKPTNGPLLTVVFGSPTSLKTM